MAEPTSKYYLIERIREYSLLRTKLIDSLAPYVHFLESSTPFHCLALFTTVTCIVSIYAQLKSLTLFSLHPTCMIIGSFIFLAEGIVSYHNRSLVEALAPIMARSRQTKVRTLHQNIQTIGASFLGLGLLFIVAHKAEEKHTVLPHTVHSILGSIVITLIVVQAVSGSQKMAQMDRSNTKIRRWHGDLGLAVWDLLCVTILSGFVEFFSFSFVHVIVGFVVCSLWLAVHVQMRRKVVDRAGNPVPPTQDAWDGGGEESAVALVKGGADGDGVVAVARDGAERVE